MRFKDKVVLITGGTRGIGKATTIAFTAEGARVAMNFRTDEKSARHLHKSLGSDKHGIYPADISDPDSVFEMIEQIVLDFGRIDILVNNAGLHVIHPIHKTSYENWQTAWRDTLATNLIGASNITYCCAQHMINQGGGKIINISSRGAFRGEPDHPAYGASKAGLNAMSQSLAVSLAKFNITVALVAPCFTETELVSDILNGPAGASIKNQSPLGRVAKPEEVAHAVLFLADEQSVYMTGTILDVNGASYLRS